MFLMKAFLVLVLMACGAFFLAAGLGAPIPRVEYHGLIVRDVPIGIAFLIAGIGLARYWKVSEEQTYKETTTNGILTTVREWTRNRKGIR